MEFPAANPAARPDQLPGAFLREVVDIVYVKLLCLGGELIVDMSGAIQKKKLMRLTNFQTLTIDLYAPLLLLVLLFSLMFTLLSCSCSRLSDQVL